MQTVCYVESMKGIGSFVTCADTHLPDVKLISVCYRHDSASGCEHEPHNAHGDAEPLQSYASQGMRHALPIKIGFCGEHDLSDLVGGRARPTQAERGAG
jgi:hypothetical protein